MNLNHDIIRDLLIEIEQKGVSPHEPIEHLKHPKLTDKELSYYLWQLKDGGLIVATDDGPFIDDDYTRYWAQCLTFKGHEFVGASRDSLVWKNAKDAARRSGTASLDLLGKLLLAAAKQKIQEHTGIDLD